MVYTFPVILHIFLIWILRTIFEYFLLKLTNWENHKFKKSWEDSIVFKKFIFYFLNYYGALFIIALAKTNVGSLGMDFLDECVWDQAVDPKLRCFLEAKNHATKIFFLRLFEHLIGIVIPKVVQVWQQRNFSTEKKKYSFSSIDNLIATEDTRL